MADFDNGYADVTTLNGRELFLLYDPLFREGLNITVESFVAEYGVSSISDVPGLVSDLAVLQGEVDLNTAKISGLDLLSRSNFWTGQNTYEQTQVFNSSAVSGSFQLQRATTLGDINSYIQFTPNSEIEITSGANTPDTSVIVSGSVDEIYLNANAVAADVKQFFAVITRDPSAAIDFISGSAALGGNVMNFSNTDKDFSVRKNATGTAINYDAGTDVTTISSAQTIFDSNDDGALQTARISDTTTNETYIQFSGGGTLGHTMSFQGGTDQFMQYTNIGFLGNRRLFFNSGDVLFRKEVDSSEWLNYDATNDRLTIDEDTTLVGAFQTGTWTPNISFVTLGTHEATYDKSGKSVTLRFSGEITGSSFSFPVSVNSTSLPFAPALPASDVRTYAAGTFYNAADEQLLVTPSVTGVVAFAGTGGMYFMNPETKDGIDANDIEAYLAFTVTYQTTE